MAVEKATRLPKARLPSHLNFAPPSDLPHLMV